MAVVELKNILERVRSISGEDTEDTVSLIEDITDTFNAKEESDEGLGEKIKELEQKVVDVEKEWKKRYTDRFFDGDTKEDREPPQETEEEVQNDAEKKLKEMAEFAREGGY